MNELTDSNNTDNNGDQEANRNNNLFEECLRDIVHLLASEANVTHPIGNRRGVEVSDVVNSAT